jgi:hypothetical protein
VEVIGKTFTSRSLVCQAKNNFGVADARYLFIVQSDVILPCSSSPANFSEPGSSPTNVKVSNDSENQLLQWDVPQQANGPIRVRHFP